MAAQTQQGGFDLASAIQRLRLGDQLTNPVLQGPAANLSMGASPAAINAGLAQANPGAPSIPVPPPPSSKGGAPSGSSGSATGPANLMGMTGAQLDQILGTNAQNNPIQGPAAGLPMGASPAQINAALMQAGGPSIPLPPNMPPPPNAQSYLKQ